MIYTIILLLCLTIIFILLKGLNKNKSTSYLVKEIYVYPIKSCAGIKVDSHILDQYGFKYDRNWVVVDGNNVHVTQREYPKMALIKTGFDDGYLTISAEGMETKKIPLEPDEDSREKIGIRVWKSKCFGLLEGDDISEWISKFLGEDKKFKLVRLPSDHERKISKKFLSEGSVDNVSYVDAMPFLIVTDVAVDKLVELMDDKSDKNQYKINRFRPNIIVSGANAFDERNWKTIKIGNVKLYAGKPCLRCKLTTVDPEKGEFSGEEPLNTINNKLSGIFGNYFIHDKEGYGQHISVGMKLDVLERFNS